MKKRSKILASLVLAGTMVLDLPDVEIPVQQTVAHSQVRLRCQISGRYLPTRTARGSRCRYKGL